MKKILTFFLSLMIFLSIAIGCVDSQKYKFEKIDYVTSLGYRYCYLKSDTSLIRELFSEKIAHLFLNDTTRFNSKAVSKDELHELKIIFGEGKLPNFDGLIDKSTIDGYRIHLGVETDIKKNTNKIALILTFGKQKYKSNGKDVFLDDSLELGIYKIIPPQNFQFPKIPPKGLKDFLHFSCNPECDGDNLE